MVNSELNFCTDCGAQNKSDNEFCIGCGVRLKSGLVAHVKESPAVFTSATMPDDNSKDTSKISGFASQKNLIILVAAVLVSFVAGAGLASENVFSGIVGNRYTEKRLTNEKKQSYEIGYKSGEDAGYDDGYQRGNGDGYARGYSTGEIDGCNKVFDRVGADQLIAIFYPYRAFNIGRYYSTRSDTC
jgi:hypothetical protein